MESIDRLTTRFIDLEDRIQVTGATATGRSVTLWLPQRLLNRVVPALCERLAPEGKDLRAGVKNSFAQQAAIQAMSPQPAVPSDPASDAFTIRSISLRVHAAATEVIFHDRVEQDGSCFSATLNDPFLRQWLSILHSQYVKAEWSLHVWPEWVGAARQESQRQPLLMQ